jgi:hypothetical protein
MILINAGTLDPRVANWVPRVPNSKYGILFFSLGGQYKAIKFSIY